MWAARARHAQPNQDPLPGVVTNMMAIVRLALTTTISVCVAGCGTAPAPQAAPVASAPETRSAVVSGTELPAPTATPAAHAGAATMPTAGTPSAALESAPASPEQAMVDYKNELYEAGEASRCDEVVARMQQTMARDTRLADAQIQAEIDHFERVKGSMPYPTPGTACSIFGFQKVLHGALAERRRGRSPGR
jgi:hypothetical protein